MSLSSRRKRRGLHVRLTTLVVSACTMVALLALMAQSASAFVPCPTREARAGPITRWTTIWGRTRETAKGVTYCAAIGGEAAVGFLQIVDATDGARIRLQSQVDASGEPAEVAQPNTLFVKRTARDWYTFIRGLRGGGEEEEAAFDYLYESPTERLFSTTNATFFKTTSGGSTKLPLPFVGFTNKTTLGVAYTSGQERERGAREPDWNAPKKVFVVGHPLTMPQLAQVGAFPTFYPEPWGEGEELYWESIEPWQEITFEAAVGFSPEYRIGERARRNYLGTYGYITYIFTSRAEYTNAQMKSIMQEIQPGMEVIQMDGGGSAQISNAFQEMPSSEPIIERKVPNVLAIYKAP